MNINAINNALAKALGIDVKYCTGFELHVGPAMAPQLTVRSRVLDADGLKEITGRYTLTPLDPPAFDLDALCAAARQRLAAALDESCAQAQAKICADFRALELDLRLRSDSYIRAILRQAQAAFVDQLRRNDRLL